MIGRVNTRKLAFWESLIDLLDQYTDPTTYLDEGEKVKIIANANVYGTIYGDKEYCKVNHPAYGMGYVLVSGITPENQNGNSNV